MRRLGRADLWLLLAAILAGGLFFNAIDRLWPLADPRLASGGFDAEGPARDVLERQGFDLSGYQTAGRYWLDGAATDFVSESLGATATTAIREGLPTLARRVYFKRSGEPRYFHVDVHPNGEVLGWNCLTENDTAGASLSNEDARELAQSAIVEGLGLSLEAFEERAVATAEQIDRRDHTFRYERPLWAQGGRERLTITVAGSEVIHAKRNVVPPDDWRRTRRTLEATGQALETVGILLLAVGGIVAFVLFLGCLRKGQINLRAAAVWPIAVFACLLATYALQPADLMIRWEPLWPRWVSTFRFLVFRGLQDLWIPLLLLAVTAAGLAMDRRLNGGRTVTLNLAGKGNWLHPRVAAASTRGFLIGLLCGGVLCLGFLALERFAGAGGSLQPRGFFFYPLNSSIPALTALLFFFGVALAEELGYRLFLGSWLLAKTHRRWVAILLPAIVYGLTHTRLDFLPPGHPDWARALLLTLVGAVWGWAFLRFDALTVVLSHFTADLFIFNWPLLAGVSESARWTALATIAVPLLPGLFYILTGRFRQASAD
ncbi:MAG: CPBP family intramembrane metalloprotease [Acidobacteriota bacterium]|nr:CPBP family intramembrane metalloprotease [Acidobacteriota bacterium]